MAVASACALAAWVFAGTAYAQEAPTAHQDTFTETVSEAAPDAPATEGEASDDGGTRTSAEDEPERGPFSAGESSEAPTGSGSETGGSTEPGSSGTGEPSGGEGAPAGGGGAGGETSTSPGNGGGTPAEPPGGGSGTPVTPPGTGPVVIPPEIPEGPPVVTGPAILVPPPVTRAEPPGIPPSGPPSIPAVLSRLLDFPTSPLATSNGTVAWPQAKSTPVADPVVAVTAGATPVEGDADPAPTNDVSPAPSPSSSGAPAGSPGSAGASGGNGVSGGLAALAALLALAAPGLGRRIRFSKTVWQPVAFVSPLERPG